MGDGWGSFSDSGNSGPSTDTSSTSPSSWGSFSDSGYANSPSSYSYGGSTSTAGGSGWGSYSDSGYSHSPSSYSYGGNSGGGGASSWGSFSDSGNSAPSLSSTRGSSGSFGSLIGGALGSGVAGLGSGGLLGSSTPGGSANNMGIFGAATGRPDFGSHAGGAISGGLFGPAPAAPSSGTLTPSDMSISSPLSSSDIMGRMAALGGMGAPWNSISDAFGKDYAANPSAALDGARQYIAYTGARIFGDPTLQPNSPLAQSAQADAAAGPQLSGMAAFQAMPQSPYAQGNEYSAPNWASQDATSAMAARGLTVPAWQRTLENVSSGNVDVQHLDPAFGTNVADWLKGTPGVDSLFAPGRMDVISGHRNFDQQALAIADVLGKTAFNPDGSINTAATMARLTPADLAGHSTPGTAAGMQNSAHSSGDAVDLNANGDSAFGIPPSSALSPAERAALQATMASYGIGQFGNNNLGSGTGSDFGHVQMASGITGHYDSAYSPIGNLDTPTNPAAGPIYGTQYAAANQAQRVALGMGGGITTAELAARMPSAPIGATADVVNLAQQIPGPVSPVAPTVLRADGGAYVQPASAPMADTAAVMSPRDAGFGIAIPGFGPAPDATATPDALGRPQYAAASIPGSDFAHAFENSLSQSFPALAPAVYSTPYTRDAAATDTALGQRGIAYDLNAQDAAPTTAPYQPTPGGDTGVPNVDAGLTMPQPSAPPSAAPAPDTGVTGVDPGTAPYTAPTPAPSAVPAGADMSGALAASNATAAAANLGTDTQQFRQAVASITAPLQGIFGPLSTFSSGGAAPSYAKVLANFKQATAAISKFDAIVARMSPDEQAAAAPTISAIDQIGTQLASIDPKQLQPALAYSSGNELKGWLNFGGSAADHTNWNRLVQGVSTGSSALNGLTDANSRAFGQTNPAPSGATLGDQTATLPAPAIGPADNPAARYESFAPQRLASVETGVNGVDPGTANAYSPGPVNPGAPDTAPNALQRALVAKMLSPAAQPPSIVYQVPDQRAMTAMDALMAQGLPSLPAQQPGPDAIPTPDQRPYMPGPVQLPKDTAPTETPRPRWIVSRQPPIEAQNTASPSFPADPLSQRYAAPSQVAALQDYNASVATSPTDPVPAFPSDQPSIAAVNGPPVDPTKPLAPTTIIATKDWPYAVPYADPQATTDVTSYPQSSKGSQSQPVVLASNAPATGSTLPPAALLPAILAARRYGSDWGLNPELDAPWVRRLYQWEQGPMTSVFGG
jgi:hypothetical protein